MGSFYGWAAGRTASFHRVVPDERMCYHGHVNRSSGGENMATLEELIERVRKTQHGFGDIRKAAEEVMAEQSPAECSALAKALYQSEAYQARALATFIFGHLAADSSECFQFLYQLVSQDSSWQVQEILAQAFDLYCVTTGYERA